MLQQPYCCIRPWVIISQSKSIHIRIATLTIQCLTKYIICVYTDLYNSHIKWHMSFTLCCDSMGVTYKYTLGIDRSLAVVKGLT